MGFFDDLFGGGTSKAAGKAADYQKKAHAELAPWRELGTEAVGQLRDIYLTGEMPYTESPGYQFRVDEATRGLSNFLASRGLSRSGRAVRGGARLVSDLAADEYDRGYNRLANLAGIGGTAIAPSQAALTQRGQYGIQGAQARQSGYQDIANTAAGLAGYFI